MPLALQAEITIRNRLSEETPRLAEIEHLASARFASFGFPSLVSKKPVTASEFEDRYGGQEFWVAEDSGGTAIGFAAARDLDGVFHIKEMSVVPEAGESGVGTRLLHAVVDRARWSDYAAVTLTTFKQVPFNAPFYSKNGFIEINHKSVGPELERVWREEVPAGILPSTRILMVKRL